MIIKKNDIQSDEEIFDTITSINIKFQEIKNSSVTTKYLPIIFDSEIKFINPLFFSLLLQVHEKYISDKIALAIDILNFNQDEKYINERYPEGNDPRQHYVFRLFLSFVNTPYFQLHFVQSESSLEDLRNKYDTIIRDKIKDKVFVDKSNNTYHKLIYL